MEHRFFTTEAEDRLLAYCQRLGDPPPLRALGKQEWIARRAELRPRLLAALGLSPAPDRLPLQAQHGPAREEHGVAVEAVAWQTWPRVWAHGLLCRPAEPTEPRPAVLVVTANPAAGSVQSWVTMLAGLGYTVLLPYRSTVQDLSRGLVPATVNVWTSLRGLDLLATLPYVDRERLGLIGEGEGSPEAAMVFALDDRPRAAALAAPAQTASTVPGLQRFSSWAEVCALPSPRALLLLDPEEQPGEPLADSLRAIYRLWLQPDRLAEHRSEEGQPWGTPALCAWFERELRGVREPVEVNPAAPALEWAPPSRLVVEGDQGDDGIREWFDKRVTAQPPQLESRQSRRNYQDRARAELRELLGEPTPASLHTEWGATQPWGQLLSFRSERDVRLAALWSPAEGPGLHPTLVAAFHGGKQEAERSPVVRAFREAGWSVLAPDVRFRGELDLGHTTSLQHLEWGRPEAGMATDDLRACIQWLFEREDVDFRNILLFGDGHLGVAALLAAALDDRAAGAVASCQATTYRDGGDLPVIPNILRVADVPQIASLVAPRPLWLFNVPAERVGFSSRRYYDWTRRTYQSLGDEEALKMSQGNVPDGRALLEWLEPRLKRQAKRRSF